MRIEKRLKFLAEQNPNYSLLWAQWEFDKKLLSRALNTVSRDFPHYSLHDSSHSSTIITQIEKVIEPNIDRLSATDCWLILEACYWHDAGMIITNEEKKRLLNDPNFYFYLKEVSEGGGELAAHAAEIIGFKKENDIAKALNISNSLTFIIADFFRKIHAERSGLNVNEPLRVNIYSPRTSLIPQRLFNFVSQIVQCHGKEPQEILSLAKYNDGMDAEDYAHPRYVAALLRIGDLLDIDDGRFCPTLLANIGSVPKSSLDHQEKHASIKHLLINNDVIEIRAECEQYGAYQAQQSWFDYIQKEFDYQKRVWNEIVPENDYRALPTIGFLSCIIRGYVAIDGEIPKITLNSERVYEYITGSQIYSERYPFVREVIQNSIDATIYKLWSDLIDSEDIINLSEIYKRNIFNEKLSNYTIEIKCSEVQNGHGSLQDCFYVKDSGTGMSLDDIKKILIVGSESVTERKNINRNVPDWGKPSGYFGIGLQTVFKLCDKVIIKTKKTDNPCFIIEVINNNGKGFDILINETVDRKFEGTELTALFERKELNSHNYSDIHQDILKDFFDPLLLNDNSIFQHSLLHTLKVDFDSTPIQLKFNGVKLEKKDLSGHDNKRSNNLKISDFELGVDCNLHVHVEQNQYSIIEYKYKGVEFDTPRPVMGLSGYIDIFKNNAGYWLTIDRKKGRSDKEEEIFSILESISVKHHDYLRKNTIDEVQADYFIYAKVGVSEFNSWKSFLINKHKVSEFFYDGLDLLAIGGRYSYHETNELININSLPFSLLSEIAKREKLSVYVKQTDTNSDLTRIIGYTFSFKDDGLSNFECEPYLIKRELRDRYDDGIVRKYIPCYKDYYSNISLSGDMLPGFISPSGPLVKWSDKYVFTPNVSFEDAHFNFEYELDAVYQFYAKKGILVLPEVEFKERYKELWLELSLVKQG